MKRFALTKAMRRLWPLAGCVFVSMHLQAIEVNKRGAEFPGIRDQPLINSLTYRPPRLDNLLNELNWEWVEVAGSRCRDGSPAGFFRIQNTASRSLMIFLEGGGACFNGLTCGLNPANVDPGKSPPNQGILALDDARNPVQGWNAVYVPYCTGDVMAGNDPRGRVSSRYPDEQFVGHANIAIFLERWKKEFPGLEQVLLTGESAGGFGALYNFDQTQEAFADVPVVLLDDSGVLFSDNYLAPCLQSQWRKTWNLNATLPLDCDGCRAQANGGGLVNYLDYLLVKYPEKQFAVISSFEDSTIRTFFGFGTNNCNVLFPSMKGSLFTAGLQELRRDYFNGQVSAYYINGSTHTFIGSDRFYSQSVDGVSLYRWVGDVIEQRAIDVLP